MWLLRSLVAEEEYYVRKDAKNRGLEAALPSASGLGVCRS